MKLWINGENREFVDGISLEELIGLLGVKKETVVSEVNRQIIQGLHRQERKLTDGDQIELIQFVGGG